MKKTRLVGITRTSDVSLLGSSDQRKLNSIRRITKSDPSLARVFAEPVLDANGETISWYTDLPGSISHYEELSNSDKEFLETSWATVRKKLEGLRENLNSADRIILDNVMETPGLDALHLVGHELLVSDWSAVRVGYRPKNKNIGIDLDPQPVASDPIPPINPSKNIDEMQPFLKEITSEKPNQTQNKENAYKSNDDLQEPLPQEQTKQVAESSESKFYNSLWFWAALFVILSCLHWFLLIDACGIEGIHFLNFCR